MMISPVVVGHDFSALLLWYLQYGTSATYLAHWWYVGLWITFGDKLTTGF